MKFYISSFIENIADEQDDFSYSISYRCKRSRFQASFHIMELYKNLSATQVVSLKNICNFFHLDFFFLKKPLPNAPCQNIVIKVMLLALCC